MNCRDCGSGPLVPVKRRQPGQVRAAGRGLCGPCYMRAWKAGEHIDAPRTTRSLEEFLDDWRVLIVREGCTNHRQIASAMGIDPSQVRRRLREARAAGLYVPEVVDDYARIRSQANRIPAARSDRA